MTLLLSLALLAVSPANAACGNAPCGTAVTAPAPQASAEGATHLAAAAYSKALRLEHSAHGKADKAEVAELRRELKRYSEMSASQAARHAKQIRALAARVDILDRRLRTVEARQVALVVGAGASAWFGPAISQVYYGEAIPYVTGEVGFASESKRSGWTLMGTGEYNPGLQSPGFGGYGAVYAKNPFGIRRTAVGGYAGGDFRSFAQEADYDGYKAVADAGVYLRVTADKPRDGFGAFVTVRAGGYYGMAADYTGASAPEFGGTVTATLQGGKFWRF